MNNNNTGRLSTDVDMLASLLRECASIVEKSETSPLLFKAVEALNAYAESKSHTNAAATNGNTSTPHSSPTKPPNLHHHHHKPSFQRPINKQSNLIANGWVEQQRRSTLRMVWKQILLTLVEARRPGEDTTLWIQREAQRKQANGSYKTSLEALHQIPMKWLLNVRYLDDYGDFRFCCKVYNVPEDFVFRAADEEGCKEWVATLNSAREASQNNANNHGGNSGGYQYQHTQQTFQEASFPDLLSGKSGDTMNSTNTPNTTNLFPDVNMQTGEAAQQQPKSPQQQKHQSTTKKKSLKELIAIAHGAGYNTRGMERADLEKIANHFAPASERKQQQQQQPHTNKTTNNLSPEEIELAKAKAKAAQEEDIRRKQKAKQAAEESKLQEQIKNVKLQQETQRMERTKQMQQQFEEESKQKAAAAAAAVAAEKEQQRKRKEANQRAQQWEHPTSWPPPPPSPAQQKPQPSAPPFDQHQQQYQQHRFNYQQQQQQQYYPQQQQARPQQTNGRTFSAERTADPTSPINQKYMKQMSNANLTSEQDEETAISNLKRNILITWALIPPNYNMLKPIDQLLSSIQIVFPPFCNVKQHDYFKTKWKPIPIEELVGSNSNNNKNNIPDETKLKKAHRKLRVFLHPDRLPKDFDAKQKFVCKMLWDVSNDAYEEFMKNKDDLDWVNTGR